MSNDDATRIRKAPLPFEDSRTIALLVLLVLAVCIVGLSWGDPARAGAVVAATLAAGAAGAILGFLFGIPRSLAVASRTGNVQGAGQGGGQDSEHALAFSHNTNLEQISDWLTKIVVGVSLVQSKEIATHFSLLAQEAAMQWRIAGGAVTAGALLLASALSGFLGCYIWTRTTFMQILVYSDRRLSEERQARIEAEEQLNSALHFVGGGPTVASATTGMGSQTSAEPADARKAPLAALVERVTAPLRHAPPQADDLWDSDPNKGRFGGSPQADGLRLDAEVSPLGSAGGICAVTLRVRSERSDKWLKTPVTFYLHPTFNRPVATVVPDAAGVAELRVLAAGAFTVGVEVEGESTRLELDLATLPNLPPKFREG